MAERRGNSPLRVRDLLQQREFELDVVAGAVGLDNLVEAVHLSELEDPTPWMLPQTLLLSTGLALASDEDVGARLIRNLSSAGMAALGIGLGLSLSSVPPAMTREADKCGLPLLTVPLHVPFRHIAAYVFSACSSAETYRLKRTVALQNQFLELLANDQGIEAVLDRMSELLLCSVLLFDHTGEVRFERDVGAVDADRVFHECLLAGATPATHLGVSVDGHQCFFREIRIGGLLSRLVVAFPRAGCQVELLDNVLTYTQRLIGMHLLAERDSAALRVRTGSNLLTDMLNSRCPEHEIAERLGHFGMSPKQHWRMIVCRIQDSRRTYAHDFEIAKHELRERMDFLLNTVADLLMFAEVDGELIWLVVCKQVDRLQTGITALVDEVSSRHRHVTATVGISAENHGTIAAPRARSQAEEAMAHAQVGKTVIRYDLIDSRRLLLGAQSEETLNEIIYSSIGPLLQFDEKFDAQLQMTLQAYFTSNSCVTSAAAALGVHRNTIHQRLQKIAALTKRNLADATDMFDLMLGLRAHEYLRSRVLSRRSSESVRGAGHVLRRGVHDAIAKED